MNEQQANEVARRKAHLGAALMIRGFKAIVEPFPSAGEILLGR